MDYNNKDWYYSPQTYPFYTPYQMQMQGGFPMQMQGNYLKEMEYEKDLDRMRELYPNEVKKIQKYVDEECDRMEYEGSLMFDEYPDKTMLSLVSKRIMDKIAQDSEKDEVETSECCGGPRRGGGLSDLVEVLLYNEMYRRRCRHRRCNRWW